MDLDRPNGPGSNNEHSVHLHHRDFIVTPIVDQIGWIDSVSKTEYYDLKNHFSEPQCKMTVLPLNSGKPRTCVTLNGSGIQLAVGPQPLWLRNHNSGPAQRIMVKRLTTTPHDPLGITDSACKNQSVVVSVQYDPFNPYIPIRSTTIGKSRVAKDPIAMHTSWRSNSDIASVTSIGYPRMSASGESSTMMHRLLHTSGSHPIPTPYDSRTNQYNQDLGLIHSTNGNHLESPNEGSSIDHQVTIYLHAQNITMFPTNETCPPSQPISPSSSHRWLSNLAVRGFDPAVSSSRRSRVLALLVRAARVAVVLGLSFVVFAVESISPRSYSAGRGASPAGGAPGGG
ncbi:apoptosis-inducing factorB-like [Dorcoceras hygrometricum]|uniref:Apoptosis-inducing factorB-like n=1 Tax=Dorcoceras hygrometricum TaxID=472368 RepID=A0A2Z7AWQ4_9LAMI|nr:apoptosis-inducing factorB-like [Dorcoceras hygrometricum]